MKGSTRCYNIISLQFWLCNFPSFHRIFIFIINKILQALQDSHMHPHSSPSNHPKNSNIHYHYHYHYDGSLSQARSYQPRHEQFYQEQKQCHSPKPHTFWSTSETTSWKKHLNPEVGRIYDSFQSKQSRFSERRHYQNQENNILNETTPIKASSMLTTNYSQMNVRKRQLSPLQSLYYTKKQVKNSKQHDAECLTTFSNTHHTEEDRVKNYEKEIQRLRRVEEQCQYLRNHFMLHIESKHKSKK